MNQEVKAKWLKMLETAEKHTTEFQKPGTTARCCLGHLCELYRQETGKGHWVGNAFFASSEPEDCGDATSLPQAVAIWADLPPYQWRLAHLNDDEPGFPIEEIEKL